LLTDLRNTVYKFETPLQWLLTQLAYCQSSKCPPLAHTQAREDALSINCISAALCWRPCQCPAIPWRIELVTGTRQWMSE